MPEESWYIRIRGQQQGPYTRDQLQVLIRRGVFGRMHEASVDGRTWVRASTMSDLFAAPRAPLSQQQTATPPQGTPPPTTSPPTTWYFARDDVQYGPLSWNDLQTQASTGSLLSTDLVWTDGMPNWIPAPEVADLRRLMTPGGAIPLSPLSPLPSPTPAYGAYPTPQSNYAASPMQAAPMQASPYADPYAAAAPPQAERQSSSALISLIAGILGWTVIPAIGGVAAIVFGHMALSEIKRSGGLAGGRTRAIVGLAMGYSAVVLVPILIFTAYKLRN